MPASLLLVLALALPRPAQGEAERLWAAGQRADAIAALARELEAAPGDTQARRRLVAWELQVHWYAAALEHMAPLGSEADGQRGAALYMLTRYEEALPLLDPAVPTQALMRLEALEALDRPEEAASALEHVSAALGDRHPKVLAARGRALARAGRHAEAVAPFREAHAAEPLDGEALFGLGRALVQSGAREEGLALLERHRALLPLLDALDFAQRGLDLAPLHGPNHAAVGDAWRALGAADKAGACYEAARRHARGEEHVPIALRHARLLSEDAGDADAAVAVLERAAQQHPDARLFVRAGDVLLEGGRPVEAVQRYWRARELQPGDEAIQARIERAQKAYREARDEKVERP